MQLGLWQLPTVSFVVSVGEGVPEDCVNRGLWPLPKTGCLPWVTQPRAPGWVSVYHSLLYKLALPTAFNHTYSPITPPGHFSASHCSESRHLGVSPVSDRDSFQMKMGTQGFRGLPWEGSKDRHGKHRARTRCQDGRTKKLLPSFSDFYVTLYGKKGLWWTLQRQLLAVPTALYNDVGPKEDREALSPTCQSPNRGVGL